MISLRNKAGRVLYGKVSKTERMWRNVQRYTVQNTPADITGVVRHG